MKIILSTIYLALTTTFFTQNVILNENFNSGFPLGWSLIDNDNLTPFNDPSVNFITDAFVVIEDYDSIGIGDQILVATSWHAVSGMADDYLILPRLKMGSIGNFISFDAKSVDAAHPDGIEIRISKTGNTVADFLVEPALYNNIAVSPYWTNYSVSLDQIDVSEDSIYIAFRHFATDQYILALDNISIRVDDPSEVSETLISKINIAPNPVKDNLMVSGLEKLTAYSIFDITGKLTCSGSVYQEPLNVSMFKEGIYFIRIDGYPVEKIVKL